MASLAVSCAHCVLYIFRKAIWPASFVACSLYDWEDERRKKKKSQAHYPDDGLGRKKDRLTILHIWYVTFSSHACTASARAIIFANLARTTACELSGFPNALRCEAHFRHSSTIKR
jgi:hypothetical protein